MAQGKTKPPVISSSGNVFADLGGAPLVAPTS